MPHPTRHAALVAVLALALGATACASRRTTSDTQTTTSAPAVTSPGPATPSARPADEGVTAGTLPADSAAPGARSDSQPAAPAASTAAVGPLGLADIFFGFDDAGLSGEARQTLERNAEFLRRNHQARIQIEGHADERGSTGYNLALGDRRAMAAKRYLESLGVETTRVSTVSFGEEKPFVVGQDEEAWSQNRRGHFLVVR